MALENIVSEVDLDVYDHDQIVPGIKAISGDSVVRYVRANIFRSGEAYVIDDKNVTVKLHVLRPDRTLVIGPAAYTTEAVMISPEYTPTSEELEDEDGETYTQWYYIDEDGNRIDVDSGDVIPAVYSVSYELYAELSKEMLAVPGTAKGQFKIEVGSQVLKTSMFNIVVGEDLSRNYADTIDLTMQ